MLDGHRIAVHDNRPGQRAATTHLRVALVAASAITAAPAHWWSTPESVQAVQSLRLPGNGSPTATVSRVLASMTTCRLVEYR
ncbi:hypothetical protein Athai_14220 [Actinocatenispora thailandica]|uniref:Uncharacterized protein n=1 Tax=Actinocatenispora thailandica TaxID=227318 RepID=A0A7R7HWF3_9ACTN|nr:hypothetical protein [Actinocatenispora thailandica]BCJ33919.1 hypothetical protein Athai_14220 [Actinocatenispora thailandica]